MKNSIPLIIRDFLDRYANYKEFVEFEFPTDTIIHIKDINPKSLYWFTIKSLNPDTDFHEENPLYTYRYSPIDKNGQNMYHGTYNIDKIEKDFKKWLDLLIESNDYSPMFDDNFEKAYYDDIGPSFEIIDDDAEINPFRIEQQKRVVAFLDKAEKVIAEEKVGDPTTKEETIKLIQETRNAITVSTKKKVVDNIRRIIAKGFKFGLKVGEKLLIDFTTELAKKLLLGQ